jgi:hypothetical protein
MLLEELETQLLALTPTEKAEVIRLLAQSLSNSWPGITKTPDVCGGDACIAKTRTPSLAASKVFAAKVQAMPNFYNFIPI